MSKTLISVIIPVYNGERYLERCLNSVIAQTHTALEIIVVNDGSVDGSAKIMDHFARKDPRIIAIHQENAGVSAARNAGLTMATGDCIGFVDGDDEILPDMYAFLLRNMEQYDADISHCGFELVKKTTTIPFHGTGLLLVQDNGAGISEILSGRRVEPSACTKLYKRMILKDVQFPIGVRWNEDVLFNILAFNQAKKSVFEDMVKYRYLQNGSSASQNIQYESMAKDVYRVTTNIKEVLTDPRIKKNVDVFFAGKLLGLLQGAKKGRIENTEIIKKVKNEIVCINAKELGFRIRFLSILLLRVPFLYGLFRYIYEVLLVKNQKWKDD